ncbi:MAG TPA: MinD/ParA family protein [Bdellovibrionales bacterium]|nr:MinD/ParA family protein [Bdellovibrionales bacterium]
MRHLSVTASGLDQTRTISVTSGKGGVGKTTLVCNMAFELAAKGSKVLILDGDLGMANVDIMFGQRARLNIGHVLENRCQLEDILLEVAPNVHLIPGGSGVYELSRLQPMQKHILLDQVGRLNRGFDYMLVDTAPGIDDDVLYLNAAAQEILVVLTPDPSSLTDAYALIKVLNQRYRENRFSVVANMVRDEAEARAVFQKISDVANRFLCVSLDYRGFIPSDLNLRQANRAQEIVVQTQTRAPATVAIRELVKNIHGSERALGMKGGLQFFWNQLSGVA